MAVDLEEFEALKARVGKTKPNSDARMRARIELGRAINTAFAERIPDRKRRLAIRRIIEGKTP
ncbi:hypothetical protein ACJ4V0_15940 [Phreatobacter sp. HK31-P]